MRKRLLILLAVTSAPTFAQESDKDYLTAFLEDSLSDVGREVTITGFAGALSSQATIESMTFADDAGVWLTLDGVKLDWSRSSLLSGELVVNELSAKHLTVVRLPNSEGDGLPAPEAAGFSLPELPVSIDIEAIEIEWIELDRSVLGQPVEGRLGAALQLSGGAGRTRIDLVRTGHGPTGAITLDASYDNTSRNLTVDFAAGEGKDGLVAVALGIPGAPSSDFRLLGSGPIDAFAAEIMLATDGKDRLAGGITLSADSAGGSRLKADLAGNLAPLFLPDYTEFLGTRLEVALDANRAASGALTVDRFHIKAQSLSVDGHAMIAADGLPESISLAGVVASPDGEPLLLPFGGLPTRIDRAEFEIDTAQDQGLAWMTKAVIAGLDRPDLAAETLSLSGSGRIERDATGNSFDGTFGYSATGLAPADPALGKALGPALTGGFTLRFAAGDDSIQVSDITLLGKGLSGSGQVKIKGLSAAFLTSGSLAMSVDDLSRFDGLAGRPLGGQGEVQVAGSVSQLSGEVDGTVALSVLGLRIGVDQIDRLLVGKSVASLSVLRDGSGTTIRSLDLGAGPITASMSGKVASADVDLSGKVTIDDLSGLDPGYSGKAKLDITLSGKPESALITFSGDADGLSIGNSTADPLLAGASSLSARLALSEGVVTLDQLQLSNPQLDLSVTGAITEDTQKLSVIGKLADFGLLIPDLNGPLSVSGAVLDDGTAFTIDLKGQGPGKVDARVSGSVARDFASADLSISGTGQAGLANIFIAPMVIEGLTRFDLRLAGPLQLSSLSGRVTLSNGRLSDPGLGFALEDIGAQADLKAGKAALSATAGLSTGGTLRVDGPVGLGKPYVADLAVTLERVRFFDPKLYETVLGGKLGIKGALTGGATISGAIALSETELRVPESGIDAAGVLVAMTHRNEPADVRATRVRAGLLGGDGDKQASTGAPFRLDLVLSAPSRIFLRGRGIDAELGGELRLRGTTAAVIPSGEFGLIRGRLDVLGKRLVLDRADLNLEGSFVPQLAISASSQSDGIQSTVTIEGPADDPKVAFASVPDLPQEEVLARLLFGRGLNNISALQAAQLAQAVAVLAGRGGEGVISKLRKSFGLDDLDLATADDGTTALKAGKYISENIYTEVEIDQTGTSTINLNLDLRPGVTVKGRVGADGETGVGVFIEKDY